MKKWLVVFAVTALIPMLSSDCFAQRQIEFIPGISVRETYDDNIFLDSANEQSDFITTVSPSLSLNVLSEYTKLGLNYTPSFVRYSDFSLNNATRHSATAGWDQKLTEYLKLELSDRYINSEDPLDDFTDLEAQRTARNKYWVNQGNVGLGYVFGEENRLEAGYNRRDRENTDPTLNDSADQRPFARLTHWFNVKNGVRVDYAYKDVELSLADDFTGHAPGVRYLHRFRPQSTGYLGYTYTTRDFDGITEDYLVHNGYVGLDHAFSPEYSVRAEAGYFIRVPDISETTSGPSLSLGLTKEFARGSISIVGDAGWDEAYLTTGRPTFRKYFGGSLDGSYQLFEKVSFYGRAYYRHSEEGEVRTTQIFRGYAGIRWSFMRWFFLSFQYDYADRTDDIEVSSYTDNRVMLMLSASKPYKWE